MDEKSIPKPKQKKITFKNTVPLADKENIAPQENEKTPKKKETIQSDLPSHPEMDLSKKVLDEYAKTTAKGMKSELSEAQRKGATLKVEKMVEKLEVSDMEAASILRKITEYQKKYHDKLKINWIDDRTLQKMSGHDLSLYLKTIETLINTQGAPAVVKNLCVAFAEFVEKVGAIASSKSGAHYMYLEHYTEVVKENMEQGYFDEEIDQIIIQHADIFAKGPKARLFMKLGGLAVNTYKLNHDGINLAAQKTVLNNKKFDNL